MLWNLLLTAVALVGHGALMILAINMLHGFGIRGHWPNRITYTVTPILAIAGPALAGWYLAGGGTDWPWPIWLYASSCVAIAGIGLPAVTLARWLRRPPEQVSGRAAEIDLAAEHGVENLAGRGLRAHLIRQKWNDSLRLKAQEWRVELPGLPEALDGLSLVHLTDLHMAPWYQRRFFEVILEQAERWESDLVVYTGDLIEHNEALEWVAPLMSRVRGRLGTLAILGNHDRFYDVDGLRRELARADVTDLDGRWTTVMVGAHRVAVGGTSAPWGPPLPCRPLPEADARIVLSHSPDMFVPLSRHGIDLVLSGHNHGGQIRLPMVGPVLMPSRYSRRYDEGFFRSGRSLLYVSRGVAGEKPIRYRCPIEITRLVLRSTGRREGPGLSRAKRSRVEIS